MNRRDLLKLGGAFSVVVSASACSRELLRPGHPGPEDGASTRYRWDYVSIGGGGSIPSLLIHPRVAGLAYLTADVGGCDRWDEATGTWTPLFKWAGDSLQLWGCEAVAVDPSDNTGNTLYATAGKYSYPDPPLGEVLRSNDRGKTWIRSSHRVSVASNWDQLFTQRLAVDPANPLVVYHASREGLFRTVDGAQSWGLVAGAPTGDLTALHGDMGNGTESGVAFIVIDPSSGTVTTPTRTKSLYIGIVGGGVYGSTDGGDSWQPLANSPGGTNHAAVNPAGILYVSGTAGFHRYTSGAWENISPDPALEYHCIAIDPFDASRVLVSEHTWGFHNRIWRSDTGGAAGTWLEISANDTHHFNPGWYPPDQYRASVYSLTFDPHHQGRVWYSDYYLPWRTEDIGAPSVEWTSYVKGHEELVVSGGMYSPNSGPTKLIAGVADEGGFAITQLDAFPTRNLWGQGLQSAMNVTGVDGQDLKSGIVALASVLHWGEEGVLGLSTDGGASFVNIAPPYAGAHGGRVAVGARPATGQSQSSIVWATGDWGPVYVTRDLGATWESIQGSNVPNGIAGNIFNSTQELASDRVDGNLFYAVDGGSCYRSDDGGLSWDIVATGLPTDDLTTLQAVPGRKGHLWVSFGDSGLYASTDAGSTFAPIQPVKTARLIAFGVGKSHKSPPAAYLKGKIGDSSGIFRSDDLGVTWNQIADDAVASNAPNQMVGDRQVYGRVYIGTNGSGIIVGTIAD
jgi:photosystem II stability/assembly factor-like uncharacterized protein